MRTGPTTVENNMEVPQKFKIDLPCDLAISTSGYIPRGNERTLTRYMHSHIYYSSTHHSQDIETTQMPINNEWIKKKWYTYTIEYYSATRKKDILPLVKTQMDLEHIMLSEISHRNTSTE